MEKKEKNTIPFVKAERVGNFKLWRSKYSLQSGKDKTMVDCLHISNLDGSWMIRIPSTMTLYGTICQGFELPEKQRNEFLGMMFGNIYAIGTSSNEAIHYGFNILFEMMSFPYLMLPEKEMVKRMKDGLKAMGIDKKESERQVKEMCEYRKDLYAIISKNISSLIDDFEAQRAARAAKESEAQKQLEQDAIAEQAMEVLNENKEEEA